MSSAGTRRPISSDPQKVPRSAKSQRRKTERAEAKAVKAAKAQETTSDAGGAVSKAAGAVSKAARAVSTRTRGYMDRVRSLRPEKKPQPDEAPDGESVIGARPVLGGKPVTEGDSGEIDLREPAVHPRIEGRRKDVLSDERLRRRRYRIAGLCVALVLSAAVAVAFSPLFDMDHLLVEGVEGAPAAAVSEATGLAGGTALFAVDASDVRNRIEDLPWVSHAAVRVVWPDRVEVLVTPQRPVANVAVGDEQPQALAAASGQVMVYEDVAPLVPFTAGLPVLRMVGTDTDEDRITDALMALDLFGPSTLGLIGELRVDDGGDLLLMVGPGAAEGAEVTIGPAENLPEKAQAIESVLSGVVETRCLGTLDVSVPSRITIERVPGCDLPAPQQAEDR